MNIDIYADLDQFATLYMAQGMTENEAYELAYSRCESDEPENENESLD